MLPSFLLDVRKPGRYVGGELNSIQKNPAGLFRFALAYPDLYEIGMSNIGLSILYHRLNEEPDIYCERVFAPYPDLEAFLLRERMPLFSLETQSPLFAFHAVGFSLQYEMTYPQVLNMLFLGGIPLHTVDRRIEDPVVIAGGPGTSNCEPMAPFFDAMLIGDGEEAIVEIAKLIFSWLKEKKRNRHELHHALSRIAGVYVPSLYSFQYGEKGEIKDVDITPQAPWPVRGRVVRELDSAYFPLSPILPSLEIVHDRAQVEIFRGCLRGCRFCQAGFIYRPQRFRSPPVLVRQVKEILRNTGWEELGLVSLSSCDYPHLEDLLLSLKPILDEKKVTLSLPSLRADSFSVHVAQLAQGKQMTLTFAPEAGTDSLRTALGKEFKQEQIEEAIEAAARFGFSRIKLYFMIGLPTESKEDVESIPLLVEDLRRRAWTLGARIKFSVSVSAFVPKAQTPFQWEPMQEIDTIRRKRSFLRARLRAMDVETGGQKEELSFLEGVLARGDRRVSEVIEQAWQFGARLDGWSEHFLMQPWQLSFQASGIDPAHYLYRERTEDEILPWEGVLYAASKGYLWQERERAYEAK